MPPVDRKSVQKGRGAASNPAGRFASTHAEADDDGWGILEEPLPPIETTVQPDASRTIIARNKSPDIPFTQSINPYRGCEHGCVYCTRGDTLVLMADGSTRPIADVRPGDVLYGTARQGWYRRYVKSRVLAHWSIIKPAYRITLEDGTTIVAGGDHRFLTERGWKFITGTEQGRARRPHLTLNNKLMGTGVFARTPVKNSDYRIGYLCGIIRGDGTLTTHRYLRAGDKYWDHHYFRLALCDVEALLRTQDYLRRWQVDTTDFVFQKAVGERRLIRAICTQTRPNVERIRSLVAWPTAPSRQWSAGFLAGIFDAEGSYSEGILRISNTDAEIISWIARCLRDFNFGFVVEHVHHEIRKPIDIVRLIGGLREHLRFFHSVDPAIVRKRDISGQAVKSEARLGVMSIEPLDGAMRLYDITTETGDFVANGVISHNCYARPSHAYLDLSSGLDFETRLFYKPDAAKLLTKELSAPGYECSPIALGTNTDPYQPIEREYRVTRAILETLSECNHPATIVTKGAALIARDIDLLADMAKRNLVAVSISITTLDNELKRTLEPRAAGPAARLTVVRKLAEAGVPVGVMVAPVIPVLTDHELESILEAAAGAGARRAGYVMLRLPFEVKALFREWLQEQAPLKAEHVMARVHELRGGRDNDPRFGSRMRGEGIFAELFRKRFEVACRRYGLNEERRELDTSRFVPPRPATPQLSLL
jgi:DNA repair photolyase